jgi:hypothetical protein
MFWSCLPFDFCLLVVSACVRRIASAVRARSQPRPDPTSVGIRGRNRAAVNGSLPDSWFAAGRWLWRGRLRALRNRSGRYDGSRSQIATIKVSVSAIPTKNPAISVNMVRYPACEPVTGHAGSVPDDVIPGRRGASSPESITPVFAARALTQCSPIGTGTMDSGSPRDARRPE